MKNVFCVILTFLLAAALFACSKEPDSGLSGSSAALSEAEQESNATEKIDSSCKSEVPQVTEWLLCSLPTKPVEETEFSFTVPDEVTGDMQIHFPAADADPCGFNGTQSEYEIK